MTNQTLINSVDQEEISKFLLSEGNIENLQIYLYYFRELQSYTAKHDKLQTFLNNAIAKQFNLDNSDVLTKQKLNLQILYACVELKKMDSAELISCVITSDAISMTTDSIFEPEKESEYLPETVNITNQQYDEYVSTMFLPQNQPISGE